MDYFYALAHETESISSTEEQNTRTKVVPTLFDALEDDAYPPSPSAAFSARPSRSPSRSRRTSPVRRTPSPVAMVESVSGSIPIIVRQAPTFYGEPSGYNPTIAGSLKFRPPPATISDQSEDSSSDEEESSDSDDDEQSIQSNSKAPASPIVGSIPTQSPLQQLEKSPKAAITSSKFIGSDAPEVVSSHSQEPFPEVVQPPERPETPLPIAPPRRQGHQQLRRIDTSTPLMTPRQQEKLPMNSSPSSQSLRRKASSIARSPASATSHTSSPKLPPEANLPEVVSTTKDYHSDSGSSTASRRAKRMKSVASQLNEPLTPIVEMSLSPVERKLSGRTLEIGLQALDYISKHAELETEFLDRKIVYEIYPILVEKKLVSIDPPVGYELSNGKSKSAFKSILALIFALPSESRIRKCFMPSGKHKCSDPDICIFACMFESLTPDSTMTVRSFLTTYINMVLNYIRIHENAEERYKLLKSAVSPTLRAEIKGVIV